MPIQLLTLTSSQVGCGAVWRSGDVDNYFTSGELTACNMSCRRMPLPRSVVSSVMLLILGLFEAVAAGQGLSRSTANQRSAEGSKQERTPEAITGAGIPRCPPAGLLAAQPLQPGIGHHRVILSWNASSHSPDAKNNPVGYCLYRSKKRKDAKQNPTCRDCEQVNSTPVAGTSCVDDLVEDRATYYYVVTAIDANGETSSSSNEFRVSIPAAKLSSSFPLGSPAPLSCRR